MNVAVARHAGHVVVVLERHAFGLERFYDGLQFLSHRPTQSCGMVGAGVLGAIDIEDYLAAFVDDQFLVYHALFLKAQCALMSLLGFFYPLKMKLLFFTPSVFQTFF